MFSETCAKHCEEEGNVPTETADSEELFIEKPNALDALSRRKSLLYHRVVLSLSPSLKIGYNIAPSTGTKREQVPNR